MEIPRKLLDLTTLPVDVIELIVGYLSVKAIRHLANVNRRYRKLRTRLLASQAKLTSRELTASIVDQDSIFENLDRFRNLVLGYLQQNIWFLTWTDLSPRVARNLELWIVYLSSAYGTEFNKGSYVLRTLLYILWNMRKVNGNLFPFLIDQDFNPCLELSLFENRFSFRLTMFILAKMTRHRYSKLIEYQCSNYYSDKVEFASNAEDELALLCKIRPHFPKFYYSKLSRLRLNSLRWTQLFVDEIRKFFKTIKYGNTVIKSYFTSLPEIYLYFGVHYLEARMIKKKLGVRYLP